jgi:hypothetical protein
MSWSIHPGIAVEDGCAAIWREVHEKRMHSHPLLDARFVVPMLHHFGNPKIRLAVETHGDEPVSAALIEPYRAGAWRSFLPSQAQIAPAMFGRLSSSQDDERRFASLFRELPGTPIMVGVHNQDTSFSDIATGTGCVREILPHVLTVGVSLDRHFDAYWGSRSSKIRKETARSLRNLEKDGLRPTLAERVSRIEMPEAVMAHGDLESMGWKAGTGTAIHRDNAQGRFYTDVMNNFAAAGLARAYQLYFNDTLAASQLTIEQNGMMVLLKTSHRESFARYAPGRMLDYLMLRELFSTRRVRVVEFYTDASAGDARWADFERPIVHVNLYRSAIVARLVGVVRRVQARHTAAAPDHSATPLETG